MTDDADDFEEAWDLLPHFDKTPYRDITGHRFGRLTVIRKVPRPDGSKDRSSWWLCKCDCKKTKVASRASLRKRHVRSCGCLQKEYRHSRKNLRK